MTGTARDSIVQRDRSEKMKTSGIVVSKHYPQPGSEEEDEERDAVDPAHCSACHQRAVK